MSGPFELRVRSLSKLYQRRVEATIRQSVQDVVEDANTVRGFGGRMRVDTGFLRASGGAAIGEVPRGPSDNPGDINFESDEGAGTGEPIAVALGSWDFEKPLFYGWSAAYARARESKDGFMRTAAQKWDRYVRKNARRAASRIR